MEFPDGAIESRIPSEEIRLPGDHLAVAMTPTTSNSMRATREPCPPVRCFVMGQQVESWYPGSSSIYSRGRIYRINREEDTYDI